MFTTIIVGCDGSMGSLAAIELGARLCDPDGELVLTSVYPQIMPLPEFTPPGGSSAARANAEEILRISAKRVPASVRWSTCAEGCTSTAGGINAVAERKDADLIVLGPSHRHSVGRMMGRMTVQRLLHGAPCAVAVAAEGAGSGPIVVGYDGSPESRLALDTAYRLAPGFDGAVVELRAVFEPLSYYGPYVAAVDPELEQAMRERIEAELAERQAEAPEGVEVTTRVEWGSAPDVLLDVAKEEQAALVITGSRGYGPLHRAIAGSVSGALLTQTRVPVLVTPRGAEVAGAVA